MMKLEIHWVAHTKRVYSLIFNRPTGDQIVCIVYKISATYYNYYYYHPTVFLKKSYIQSQYIIDSADIHGYISRIIM